MRRHAFGHVEVDDAGLDDGNPVAEVDLEDAVHAGEGENNAPLGRHRAPGQSGSRSPWNNREVFPPRRPNHGRDLPDVSGQDDDLRHHLQNGAVLLVDDDILLLGEDVAIADDLLELLNEGLSVHFAVLRKKRI